MENVGSWMLVVGECWMLQTVGLCQAVKSRQIVFFWMLANVDVGVDDGRWLLETVDCWRLLFCAWL